MNCLIHQLPLVQLLSNIFRCYKMSPYVTIILGLSAVCNLYDFVVSSYQKLFLSTTLNHQLSKNINHSGVIICYQL